MRAKSHVCQVSCVPSLMRAKSHVCQVSCVPSLMRAKSHACQVSRVPSLMPASRVSQVHLMSSWRLTAAPGKQASQCIPGSTNTSRRAQGNTLGMFSQGGTPVIFWNGLHASNPCVAGCRRLKTGSRCICARTPTPARNRPTHR